MVDQNNVIESGVPFSKSVLWELMRDFYSKSGVSAWENKVPFYVTSNPFIAHCYAEVLVGYIQDLVNDDLFNHSSPLYILELGTGSGKFSSHCMRSLTRLLKLVGLQDLKIKYIMSDLSPHNLTFWQGHEKLQPFVKQGMADFSCFDPTNDTKIVLTESGETLKQGSFQNPLCVIGNYFFDSIPNDVFHVTNGVLHESLTTLTSDKRNIDRENIMGTKIDTIRTQFDHQPTNGSYYKDSKVDAVLDLYKNQLSTSTFNFPIASIQVIQNLMRLSGDQVFILSSDKGLSTTSQVDGRSDPYIAPHHGAFSMTVNYHALGEYCKQLGGDVHHQTQNLGIKTCVLSTSHQISSLRQTSLAINRSVDNLGPADFYNYHSLFRDHKDSFPLKLAMILSHLKASCWDPRIFNLFIENIIKAIPSMTPQERSAFELGAKEIEANTFHMPGILPSYFDLAVFYQYLGQYDNALKFYLKSIECYGRSYSILFNTGLSYHHLGQQEEALSYFQQAQDVDNREDAREWIAFLSSKK